MKKNYFLIAGIVWLILVGFGLYFYNKPHVSAAGMEADVSLDAVDLYAQYQKDQTLADKKYLDKIVEVTGKITDLQQTGATTSIQLDGGSSAGGINCSLPVYANSAQLPVKGSMVTVKGRCSGFLMDVDLVDCVIER